MRKILPADPVAPAAPAPSSASAFRVAFLTASTWSGATATPTELAYAMRHWEPEQTVAFAISRLHSRRALDRRGLLRKMEREAKAAADEL